jgi:hypothetical protein
MFTLKVKYVDNSKAVKAATEKAAYRNLGHAAASIRLDAMSTLVRPPGVSKTAGIKRDARGRFLTGSGKRARIRSKPSEAGGPPYSPSGALKRSIAYSSDGKTSAVVGAMSSIVGESGSAHELGGYYKRQYYPVRAFMFPALLRGAPRFADDWRGSIGS